MLKRLVFICAAVIFLQSGIFKREEMRNTPFFYDAKGVYTVYIGDLGSSSQIESFSTEEMETFYTLSGVCGESVRIDEKAYIDTVIKRYKFKKVLEERVDGIRICYYYSDKIPVYKSINGKKVNLQTACGNGIYTIGTPIIYGSF